MFLFILTLVTGQCAVTDSCWLQCYEERRGCLQGCADAEDPDNMGPPCPPGWDEDLGLCEVNYQSCMSACYPAV